LCRCGARMVRHIASMCISREQAALARFSPPNVGIVGARLTSTGLLIQFDTRRYCSTCRILLADDIITRRAFAYGCTGPICKQGNTAILTYDFVHRSHW
jgi:hypothetical protein